MSKLKKYPLKDKIENGEFILKPITMLIQNGSTTIDYSGMFKIDTKMCHLQASFSINKEKFHPLTKSFVHHFLNENNINFTSDDIDEIMNEKTLDNDLYLKIIGLCEGVLWTLETMAKKKKFFPICLYHIENDMHPCYSAKLGDIIFKFSQYAKKLEQGITFNYTKKT
mgnify:CR=1 FL=1